MGSPMTNPKTSGEDLASLGYRRTSRKFGHVSRVDREDWKEYMAEKHSPWSKEEGLRWVECLGTGAADHYRRCYSKDTLVLTQTKALGIPCSDHDETGFIPKAQP